MTATEWQRPTTRGSALAWLGVAVIVVAVAGAALLITRVSPAYDPYGWNIWGYQAWHGSLSLKGAPSWKPVTFFFTFPYAVFGHLGLRLWQLTAASLALAGPVIAGHIAYKLILDSTGAKRPAIIGALAAGISLLVTVEYNQFWLTAQSDPMLVTLFLLWIDLHFHKRSVLAYLALWLLALGRPEAWPFLGLYALWLFWKQPRLRVFVVAGLVLVPLLWFGVPGLTDHRPFVASSLDMNKPTEIHGNKILGTFARFKHASYWPVKVAAGIGVLLALYKRDLRVLLVALASLAWVVVEAAFALHGFSAVPRYMFEAVGAMVVVTGVGVGWLLTETRRLAGRARLAGVLAVVALAGWLVPGAIAQARAQHGRLPHERFRTTQIARLDATINALGGYRFVRSCGHPSTDVEYASVLAWYMKLNTDQIGFLPQKVITQTEPAVLFTQIGNGWVVQTYHLSVTNQARCAGLNDVYFAPVPDHPGGILMPHPHLPDSHFGA